MAFHYFAGAWFGQGNRNGYGSFLLACYNEDTQKYESVCKVGTGFSDNELADLLRYSS